MRSIAPIATSRSTCSSDSPRPARRSSCALVTSSAVSGVQDATSARWIARSSGVLSSGSRARYRSIAASVRPCRCNSSISPSRSRCAAPYNPTRRGPSSGGGNSPFVP